MWGVSYQSIRSDCSFVWIWSVRLRLRQHDGLRHDRDHLTPLVGGARSELLGGEEIGFRQATASSAHVHLIIFQAHDSKRKRDVCKSWHASFRDSPRDRWRWKRDWHATCFSLPEPQWNKSHVSDVWHMQHTAGILVQHTPRLTHVFLDTKPWVRFQKHFIF